MTTTTLTPRFSRPRKSEWLLLFLSVLAGFSHPLQAEETAPTDATPTLHVFIGLGQSLMVGSQASGSLVSIPPVWPDRALMFDAGSNSDVRMGLVTSGSGVDSTVLDPGTLVGFLPLEARIGQGGGSRGETPMEAFANTLTTQADDAGEIFRSLAFTAAFGGSSYSQIKKGTQVYANMLTALTKAVALAQDEGWNVVVAGCLVKHGESDMSNSNYLNHLLEWRNDVDADVKAITGQSEDVHFIIGQPSSHFGTPQASLAMLEAHNTSPYHHMAGPDYPFGAEYASDQLHMTGPGYFLIGEQMARSWHAANESAAGKSSITQITQARRVGTTVTLSYEVPVPPLAFDTSIVPERDTKGFRFFDSSGEISVVGATIADDATLSGVGKIELELAQSPSGEGEVVHYAMSPHSGSRTSANRPRGNVRDSAPETSALDGRSLYNWGVIQQTAVAATTISLNDSPRQQTLPQNSIPLNATLETTAYQSEEWVYQWAVIDPPGEAWVQSPETLNPVIVMSAPGTYLVRVRAFSLDQSEMVAEQIFSFELESAQGAPTIKQATLTDDAHGHRVNGDVNYGAEDSVWTKDRGQASNAREGFLKFTLPSTESMEVVGAKLRLYRIAASTAQTNELVLLDDVTWTEETLTWNNRPTVGTIIATWSDDGAAGWVELDVDPGALGSMFEGGVASFRLSITSQADSGPTTKYASKDGAYEADRAQLRIEGREIQTYEEWLQQENIPESEQAFDLDRFGTGIPNLVAYFSGLSAEAPEFPITRLEDTAWHVSLPWKDTLPPSAFFVIEQSTDLLNWSPLPWNQWQASPMEGGRKLYEASISLESMMPDEEAARFLRLRMEK